MAHCIHDETFICKSCRQNLTEGHVVKVFEDPPPGKDEQKTPPTSTSKKQTGR